jgi:hypothetical protein
MLLVFWSLDAKFLKLVHWMEVTYLLLDHYNPFILLRFKNDILIWNGSSIAHFSAYFTKLKAFLKYFFSRILRKNISSVVKK